MKKDFSKYFIAIPLKNNFFGVALVARHASDLLCIHAFAEAFTLIPDSNTLDQLMPTDVLSVARVWDDALRSGAWDVIGFCSLSDDEFERMWGVPPFGAVDTISFHAHERVEYGPDLMTRITTPCSMREALRLDADGISGPGGVVASLEAALIDRQYDDPFHLHRMGRENGIHHMRNLGDEVD